MRIDRGQVVILLVLGGLMAVFVALFGRPHFQAASDIRVKIRQLEQQLQDILPASGAEEEATESRPEADLTTAEIDIAVPFNSELGALLEKLSGDVAAESVVVRQLEAKSVVEGSDFNRIPITLRFEGSFEALFGLLQRIETTPRIIRVDELDIRGGSPEFDLPLVVDIQLSTFFRTAEENQS